MRLLDRLREGLARTSRQFFGRFDEIVRQVDAPDRRGRPVDVDSVEALEELLISADIGVAAASRIRIPCGVIRTATVSANSSSERFSISSIARSRVTVETQRPHII